MKTRREYDGSINYNKHNIHYCWYHLFSRYFIMSKANGRGTPLSTRQSNPRDDEGNIRIKELKKLYGSGTIVDNMNRIMQLVEDNKRIRGKL